MADGTIIIDTKLENDGIEKDIQNVEKTVDSAGKKIEQSMNNAEKSMKKVGTSLDGDKINKQFENVTKSIENTTKKLELQQTKLAKIKETLANTTNEGQKSKLTEQALNVEASIIKLEGQIDKLNAKKIKLQVDKSSINGLDGEFRSASMKLSKEFEDAAKKSETSISNMKTKVRGHLLDVGNIAKTSLVGLTTAIVGIGTAGIGVGTAIAKVGSDFEAEMSRVAAISGATGDEFEKLKQQAIDLGASTSFSAKQAAEAQEGLASAGFNTNEIMAAMPGMLDLAASSGEDLASSADIAASALRGFGLEADQAGHVADVLAKNAAETNAAIGDTGEALKFISPVAHSMGISIEECTAAIGELANSGIKGLTCGSVTKKLVA